VLSPHNPDRIGFSTTLSKLSTTEASSTVSRATPNRMIRAVISIAAEYNLVLYGFTGRALRQNVSVTHQEAEAVTTVSGVR
jgi:hypothetical protein